jgi:thiosulfate/3-mercaptopyruvate sulfurtransferase
MFTAEGLIPKKVDTAQVELRVRHREVKMSEDHLAESPVMEPEALHDARALAILDVRGEEDYLSQRFAGAARVPIERWEAAAKTPETGLDNAAFWRDEIGALGIDGTRRVAIYDDGRLTEAARVWFILQYFGARAAIVNGGWPALRAAYARHIANGPAPVPTPARFEPGFAEPRVGLVSRDGLKSGLGGETRIWDARSAAEYEGRDLRKNSRGGHIPGAALLSHGALLDRNGRLGSAADLKAAIAQAGFEPGQSLVTHCDGGGRAALAAIAALEAGYKNVSAYYLSFADWAKDESCPIDRS